jgi:hypothetical protein
VATSIVIAILLASVPAVAGIPFGPFLGLDFQNLDAFHDCVARNNPYLATGAECGDFGARDMNYPPLLYWSFAWTRWLPFAAGALLWAAVVLGGVLVATLAWLPRARWNIVVAVFVILLILQYPALFSMERGNNDVLVLLLWTAATLLFVSGRVGWAGALAGIAAAMKLYPTFAAIVVGTGLVWWAWRDRSARRRLLLFSAGGVLAVAVAVVATFDQTMLYFADELPQLTSTRPPLSTYTHALDNIAPAGVSWFLSLPLLGLWMVASARRLPEDPTLIFAGGLAISTYFSSVSYDYNLITVYPLLVLLFVRATDRPWSPLAFGLLLLGLVSVVGHRDWFMGSDLAMRTHIGLQWLWLVGVGLAVAVGRLRDSEGTAASATTVLLQGRNTPLSLVGP